MWNNKLTVNTGHRADKTVRDHAAEDLLSAAESSNITVYKKATSHTDQQGIREVGHNPD